MKRAACALAALVASCGPPPSPANAPLAPDAASGAPTTPGARSDAAATASGEGARTYRPASGAFSVAFPMPYSVDVRRDVAGSTELVTTTASAATADERVSYVVVETAIAPVVQYDCERAIASDRDKTLQTFGCSASGEAPIAGKPWPGREVTFACPSKGMNGILALYCDDTEVATKKRAVMVELFTASTEAAWREPDARAFLASFTAAAAAPR